MGSRKLCENCVAHARIEIGFGISNPDDEGFWRSTGADSHLETAARFWGKIESIVRGRLKTAEGVERTRAVVKLFKACKDYPPSHSGLCIKRMHNSSPIWPARQKAT